MITVYTYQNKTRHKLASKWLQENNIPYQERNVTEDNPLKREEILKMLTLVEDIDRLIRRRTKVWKSIEKDIEDMHVKSELIPFIQKNPEVLRFPIAIRGERYLCITSGVNSLEYGLLLGKTQRKRQLKDLLENAAI